MSVDLSANYDPEPKSLPWLFQVLARKNGLVPLSVSRSRWLAGRRAATHRRLQRVGQDLGRRTDATRLARE